MPVLVRSVGFALATVALCLLIGYPVAYYIAIFGGRWKNVLLALVVLPFFVNYLVRTYAWIAMLGDDGLVNGLLDTDLRFLNTPYAVIGGLVYGFLAFMILPIYASLDRMDTALIEAGKDLYGGPWQTFRHVTLPHTNQGVLAGSVLVFLPAVGDFVAASLLGGPDEIMVGNLIQQQFQASDNWPFGAALTVVMMAFLLICMLLYLRAAAREAREAGREHGGVQARCGAPAAARAVRAGTGAAAAKGLRPAALPEGLHGPLLPVPVHADRAGDPLLVQLQPLASGLPGLQPALVRDVLRVASRCGTRSSPASRSPWSRW